MLHQTKGIVLRSIKYSDTSLIVTIYTELFGIQSYMVNGVRTDRKSSSKANIYQPTTLLDLIVYHQPNKNLQRIKEAKLLHLYQTLNFSMVKNSIAIFISELISKSISEQETNADLYHFFEETFLYIDQEDEKLLGNYPLFFTIQMCHQLGFGFQPNEEIENPIFDLVNGQFIDLEKIKHINYLDNKKANWLLLLNQFAYINVQNISLNQTQRKEILNDLLHYLKIHIPAMPPIISIEILHEILH
jgi:DNA repair protein RecO (recombination protein O)